MLSIFESLEQLNRMRMLWMRFSYRDEYYNKDTEHPNEAEVIIAKQRNGPIGTVNLAWLPNYTKFANLQRREE